MSSLESGIAKSTNRNYNTTFLINSRSGKVLQYVVEGVKQS